jgi:hypothetical protein
MCAITRHQSAQWVQWLMQSHPQLVESMQKSSHHYNQQHLSPWHLEGDVWSHSMLVLQAYTLSDVADVCVGLTALLHDIGKPKAAKVLHDSKRVVFQGYESLSAFMVWGLLQDEVLALSLVQRVRIFSLVALHGCLYSGWFAGDDVLKKTQLAKAFSGMGQGFWQQLLRQIDHDIQGQITLRDNNKSVLLTLHDLVLAKHPSDSQTSHLIPIVFLIAPPGTGKTSLRERYAGYCVISRDDVLHQVTQKNNYREAWRIHDEQKLAHVVDARLTANFQQAIKAQQPILMDLTNLTRKSRACWLKQLPKNYHAQALIVIASDQTLRQRNANREDKAIPNNILEQMLLSFEHPLFDEFEQIDYWVDGDYRTLSQIYHD